MAEIELPDDHRSGNAMPRMIEFLSALLERVADSNDRSAGSPPEKVSAFHGLTRPTISIQSYLERIFKYANCSPCCFLVAYVYLDRFSRRQPLLPVDSFNVHRLLITSVLVAAKFMDDIYYNNAYYAKIGGISTAEMNFLEVEFLFGLGFQLNVSPATFHGYSCYLQREMLFMQPSPTLTSGSTVASAGPTNTGQYCSPSSSTTASLMMMAQSVRLHQSCLATGVDHQDESSSSSHQHQQLAV